MAYLRLGSLGLSDLDRARSLEGQAKELTKRINALEEQRSTLKVQLDQARLIAATEAGVDIGTASQTGMVSSVRKGTSSANLVASLQAQILSIEAQIESLQDQRADLIKQANRLRESAGSDYSYEPEPPSRAKATSPTPTQTSSSPAPAPSTTPTQAAPTTTATPVYAPRVPRPPRQAAIAPYTPPQVAPLFYREEEGIFNMKTVLIGVGVLAVAGLLYAAVRR